MEDSLEQSLIELIEGGLITQNGSWYEVVASGDKFHGKDEILEHITNRPKVEEPEDNKLPIPDDNLDEVDATPDAKAEPEKIVRLAPGEVDDSEPEPKPKPKPKVKMAMVVAIDKQGWGKRQIKHGVVADFGKGDKVVAMPKDEAKRLCSLHRRLFCILDPQTTGLLINPVHLKKPSEYTNPELMLELVNRYKDNGLFMKELRAMILETDGNLYAISRCLSDYEMVECLHTTGQYTVMEKSVFDQANTEKSQVQADNADLRSRLDMEPRPEPVK